MSIFAELRKNKYLRAMYGRIRIRYFELLTIISPELNTKCRYREKFGRWPDMDAPKTLEEKLIWLKLKRYMKDPLVIECADKVRARDYIQRCGLKQILINVYGIYEEVDEIPWDDLPNQFVLKWNFGAGFNLICKDKQALDISAAKKKLKTWGKEKCWLPYAEMQYKYAPKRIICEELLQDESIKCSIPDYKVYCFHGEPMAVLVMHDRGREIKTEFFDKDWKRLENTAKYKTVVQVTEKPACIDEMMRTARILSQPFPFVRCDFYVLKNKLYFGEMTFTPAGGIHLSQTTIEGKEMSDYLNVP